MKTIISILLLFHIAVGYGQKEYAIAFEELPQKLAAEPKPILIKIYTTWCSVCKIQDKKIENSNDLKQMFANKCYYLELDAESRKTIFFNDREYPFLPQGTGGMQSLATAMANPKDGYPTWVLLDADYRFIGKYSGLLEPEELITLLLR